MPLFKGKKKPTRTPTDEELEIVSFSDGGSYHIKTNSNCWYSRTPFEVGLILVLGIAGTIFLILLMLYVIFSVVLTDSGSCINMCATYRVFGPEAYARRKFMQDEDDEEKRSETNPCNFKMERPLYSSIAALLETQYSDSPREKTTFCSVGLLNTEWAIAPRDCFNFKRTHGNILYLRINSNYWSKQGLLKRVIDVHNFPTISVINLDKFDLNDTCVSFAVVPHHSMLYTTPKGNIFFWNSNFFHLPLENRTKFEKIASREVRLVNGIGYLNDSSYCQRLFLSPLMDKGNNFILGVPTGDNCKDRRVDEEVKIWYEDVTKFSHFLEQKGAIPNRFFRSF